MGDMPSSNAVWGAYLKTKGYERTALPNDCPDCYTVRDFANDHREGVWILGTGNHVVAVVQGHYVDDWDSGDEIPVFVWRKSING